MSGRWHPLPLLLSRQGFSSEVEVWMPDAHCAPRFFPPGPARQCQG